MQRIVINLLSNGIKFTDSGSVTVSASQADGQLVIAVSDSGKGIPADELPTIFDEYRQAEGSESPVQKEPAWACPSRRSSRNCWVGP